MNAYELLGLEPDASMGEIQRARRRELGNWHPDRNPDDASAHERFIAVQAAYEILSDTQMRQRYDAVHRAGSEPGRAEAEGQTTKGDSPDGNQWPQYWIVQGIAAPRRLDENEWERSKQEISLRPTAVPDPRRARVDGYRDMFDPAFDRRLLKQIDNNHDSRTSSSIQSYVLGDLEAMLGNMRHLRGSSDGISTGRRIVGHRAWTFVRLDLFG